MILFIDGFDLHQETDGANLPGMADYGLYYYTPPLNVLGYTTGYLTGRALTNSMSPLLGMTGSAGTNANIVPVGQATLRTSWFAKRRNNGGDDYNIWYGFLMFMVDGKYYGAQLNHTGNVRIAKGGFYPGNPVLAPNDTTEEIISAASTTQLSLVNWNHYDLLMDFPNNNFELRINGILECQGSLDTPKTTVTQQPRIAYNHPQNFWVDLDHVIVTDGEQLAGSNKIEAIAPTAAYGGLGTLRGNLIRADASYQTLRTSAIIAPKSYGADNAENVAYFLYPRNPATNQPWGTDVLTGMEGWGVCSGDLIPGKTLHLTSLGLSIVQTTSDPNGFPIISVLSPGGLTYFSGPWVKSDPNSSMAGHLNDIPRTVVYDDDKYLETQGDGCLLFQGPSSEGILNTFGITFAEEFREDFVDWYRIIYAGLPFESYFITGYTILGEGNKRFQSNYVTVNYENIPVGGAYLQGVWDYALSGDTGRWGTRQQIYRLPSGNYKHQMAQLKVRGHGRSLQIKVTSEQNKDFKINGWTTMASGNTSI